MGWTWVFLAAFLRPALELLMVATGLWHSHTNFRRAPYRFTRLIIQITTVGREHARVTELINEVHAMDLSMPFVVWVVLEPGCDSSYPAADEVIVVPAEFTTRAQYKARALEYSRTLRQAEGLDTRDVKLLFLDDDTTPTKAYIETAYAGDYDVCQGVTAPRIQYGSLPLRHFLLSHMDDMRFACCFIYCSFFQGVIRHPLYVHGEGLCTTGHAESVVTWNYPIFASEDLVFGQNAAAKGLRWGFFHEYIQLTSPWTWTDYLKQRRRWFWGNMHAVFHQGILPTWGRIIVTTKYALGLVTFTFSLTAVLLILTHTVTDVSGVAYTFFWASLIAWLFVFAASGWVNSGGDRAAGSVTIAVARRSWQTLAAVFLSPLTALWTVSALVIVAFWGNPKRFDVIAKTNNKQDVDTVAVTSNPVAVTLKG
jgi:hypothetical protein